MSQNSNFAYHVLRKKKAISGLVSSNNQSMHLQAHVE